MKQGKVRFLSLLLVLVFAMSVSVIGLVPAALAADTGAEDAANQTGTFVDGENEFSYFFDKVTGKLVIRCVRGNGKLPDFSAANPAPWAAYASKITRVIIAEGVTAVGAGAFEGCTALKSVVFPSTIESVDADAFTGADNIELIEFTGEDASDLKAVLEEASVEELINAAENIAVVDADEVEEEADAAEEAAEEQQAEAEKADKEEEKNTNAAAGDQGGREEPSPQKEDVITVTKYVHFGKGMNGAKHIVTVTYKNGIPVSKSDEVRNLSDNTLLNSSETTYALVDDGLQATVTMGAPNEQPQTFTNVLAVEKASMDDGTTRTSYIAVNGYMGVVDIGNVINVFTLPDGSIQGIFIAEVDYKDEAKTTRWITPFLFEGNDTGAQVHEAASPAVMEVKVDGQWEQYEAPSPDENELR